MTSQLVYKELYQCTLDSIPASVLLLDRRLRIVSANRHFLNKSRRSEESTLGRQLAEVFPKVLLAYTRLEERVRQVFRTSQAQDGGEMTYRAPGLSTRFYFYRLTPVSSGRDGRVNYVMLLMEDITKRVQLGAEIQRAERLMASVVDSANDIVVSMSPDGRISTWNRAAEVLSGFSRVEVQGRSLASLCAEEDAMQTLLEQMQGGLRRANYEANLITKTGTPLPVAWSYASMRDDAGVLIGLVAIGRDLTERRRMEAQLIQSAKMASLGVMAGGIAHEIRNPLGVCLAAAQLLQEYPTEPQLVRKATEKIYGAVRRASDIIENLLKFADPSQGGMVALNLNDLLKETLSLLINEMKSSRITVNTQFASQLPALMGHRNLLQQVFTNLLLNAVKAMPDGGQLMLTTERDEDAPAVRVVFSDTGQGIAPHHLPHIFDPFFSTMPVGEGVGLGLSISYAIIEQHGGRITVASQVGQGSTFIVWLPVAEGSDILSC